MASEPIEIEPMVWDAVEMERWATTVPTVHGADGSRFTVHGSRCVVELFGGQTRGRVEGRRACQTMNTEAFFSGPNPKSSMNRN